jgi:hypothetical protein
MVTVAASDIIVQAYPVALFDTSNLLADALHYPGYFVTQCHGERMHKGASGTVMCV